jgi:phosphatidylserine/phosphatidylglycerophosphate/cardiolipin synthase-like enzyme
LSDSRKPLDHWLAPEGAGKPLACLATSFSFDVDFFEQQVLGRFLGLDWKRDEGGDIAFLIEQEEKLAEARVSVIVDRNWGVEGRSLRWDLLPVGVEGGVMHAKVCLLVWENLIRCVIGSANLTPAGYRRQLEAQVVLDATVEEGPPTEVMVEAIEALRELVDRAHGLSSEEGPKRRAVATLLDAERRLEELGERRASRRGPRMAIVPGGPERPVLAEMARVWRGGPARSATVLSPFFDASGKDAAARALADRLAARGHIEVTFVVETEELGGRTQVRAPKELLGSLPHRAHGAVHGIARDDAAEPRLLHAKAVLLESVDQVALLVGSSNFTTAGLGLSRRGNLEINIAIGAAVDSDEGDALAELIPIGAQVNPEEADWTLEPNDEQSEEAEEPELPWGFVEALVMPLPPPVLKLRLDHRRLPDRWTVAEPGGAPLLVSDGWAGSGEQAEVEIPLPENSLPFFLRVRWSDADGAKSATWPVNVVDKVALPPPEELRGLPVQVLLQALASVRPLHEGIGEALEARGPGAAVDVLDPLARFSGTGQLMRRAKVASQAFAGMRARMERPAANAEALDWRLKGPFGPKAIAEGLVKQAKVGGAVAGETSFLLAELALTLSRVDWAKSGHLIPGGAEVARSKAAVVLAELREMRPADAEDDALRAYVEFAFAEATL